MSTITIDDDGFSCVGYPGAVVGIDHWIAGISWWDCPKPYYAMREFPAGWRDQFGEVAALHDGTTTYALTHDGFGIGWRPRGRYYPVGAVPVSIRDYMQKVRPNTQQLQARDFDGGPRGDLAFGTIESSRRVEMPDHLRIWRLTDGLQLAAYTHYRGEPMGTFDSDEFNTLHISARLAHVWDARRAA